MSSSLYGPEGASIVIPTGSPLTFEQQQQMILDNPFYKQQVEWLQDDARIQRERLERDKQLATQLYNINVQQASQSASGGGDYGLAAAQKQAELQKQVAARENAQKAEYIREALASRGMYSSGQLPLEQANREFDYNTLLKGIDIDLEGRASAAASARAQAQAGLALQLQEMKARYEAGQLDYGDSLADLDRGLARGKGEALMGQWDRLWKTGAFDVPSIQATWDPVSGLYKTSDGRYFNADRQQVSWSPPSSSGVPGGTPPSSSGVPGGTDLGGYVPGSGRITEFPRSSPIYKPIPGVLGME